MAIDPRGMTPENLAAYNAEQSAASQRAAAEYNDKIQAQQQIETMHNEIVRGNVLSGRTFSNETGQAGASSKYSSSSVGSGDWWASQISAREAAAASNTQATPVSSSTPGYAATVAPPITAGSVKQSEDAYIASLPKPFLSSQPQQAQQQVTITPVVSGVVSRFYVPEGSYAQQELQNVKIGLAQDSFGRSTGETSWYTKLPSGRMTVDPDTGQLTSYMLTGGGGRNFAQSGAAGFAAATPLVYAQGGVGTGILKSADIVAPGVSKSGVSAADIQYAIANKNVEAVFSRLGAEAYGGIVTRQDARVLGGITYEDVSNRAPWNLASYVNPTDVNLLREELPGVRIPWGVSETTPGIFAMTVGGGVGRAITAKEFAIDVPAPFKRQYAQTELPTPFISIGVGGVTKSATVETTPVTGFAVWQEGVSKQAYGLVGGAFGITREQAERGVSLSALSARELANLSPSPLNLQLAMGTAQVQEALAKPAEAGIYVGIGIATGAGFRALSELGAIGKAATAEKVLTEGGAWKTISVVSGKAIEYAPKILAGVYGADIAMRSTEGGTNLKPGSVAAKASTILAFEAAPMAIGAGIGYRAPEIATTAARGVSSVIGDVTYGIRQRSMGIENIGIGGGAQTPSARYTSPVQTTPLSLTQGTRISPESVLNPEQLVLSEYPSSPIMAMEAPTVFTMRTAWYDQPPTKVSTVEGMKFIMEKYGRPMQSERGQELVRAYEVKTGRKISFVDEMDRYLTQTQMVGKTPEMQRQRITEIPTYDLRPIYATPREPFSLRTEAEMRPTFNLITGEVISARGIPVMTAAERSMVITQYGLTPREVTEARVRGLTLDEILSERNTVATLTTGTTITSVGFVRQGMVGVSEKAMLPLGGLRTQDTIPEYNILGLTRPSMVGAGEYPMYDVVSIPKERTIVVPFAIPAETPSRRTVVAPIPRVDMLTRPTTTTITPPYVPPQPPGTPPPPPPGITTPKIPLLPLPFSGSGGAWGGGTKWRRSFLETFRMGLDISSQYRMPKSITSYKRRK